MKNRLPKDEPANGLCSCGGLNYQCGRCQHVNHSHTNLVEEGALQEPVKGGLGLCEACGAVLQYDGRAWPEITADAWAALRDDEREVIETLVGNLMSHKSVDENIARVEASEPDRQHGLALGRLGMLYLIMIVYKGVATQSRRLDEKIIALDMASKIEGLLDKWDAVTPGVKAVGHKQFDQVIAGAFNTFYTDRSIFQDMPK